MSYPIGQKLEYFYVSLSNATQDCNDLIDCTCDIEQHIPIEEHGETWEVVDEIVKDCRKKCSAFVRTPFADHVRSVITSTRKRLALKTALDNESSQQHSQRHFNVLVDLLGNWSNVVAQVDQIMLSRVLAYMVLNPLYSRVIEAATECFTSFKKDKEIDNWTKKFLDPKSEFNLNTLDFLVVQIAAMQELINRHYLFMYATFSSDHYQSSKAGPTRPTSLATTGDNVPILPGLLVTRAELLNWREIEAMYITLEFGYLTKSITDALQQSCLFETESGVLIPQSVEDVFFLLKKICGRSIQSAGATSACAVGHKIVELVDLDALQDIADAGDDPLSLLLQLFTDIDIYRDCITKNSITYKPLVSSRIRNKAACFTRVDDTSSSSSSSSSAAATTAPRGISSSNSCSSSSSSLLDIVNDGAFSSSYENRLAAASQITEVASTHVKGWLFDLASPYISQEVKKEQRKQKQEEADERSPVDSRFSPAPPHTVNGSADVMTTPNGGDFHMKSTTNNVDTPSMSELLLHAFDVDEEDEEEAIGVNSAAPLSGGISVALDLFDRRASNNDGATARFGPSENIKREEELIIKVNVLTIAINSLQEMKDMYQEAADLFAHRKELEESYTPSSSSSLSSCSSSCSSSSGINGGECANVNNNSRIPSTPMDLLLQELSHRQAKLEIVLQDDLRQYLDILFCEPLKVAFNKFCMRTYNISGQEMEDRAKNSELVFIIRSLCCRHTSRLGVTDVTDGEHDGGVGGKVASVGLAANLKHISPPGSSVGRSTSTSNLQRGTTAEIILSSSQPDDINGTATMVAEARTGLSNESTHLFYCAVTALLAEAVLNDLILQREFNEWGAILLQQEVVAVIRYFESIIDNPIQLIKLKSNLEKLKFALKILNFDTPGDVRRTVVPSKLANEQSVRAILLRRVEFSKEAVKSVKIDVVD